MAVSVSVRVEGIKEVQATLARIDPKVNSAWVSRALVKCALLVQQIATTQKIKPGGKGPPVPDRLTSRTGTLRRSIGVDRSRLPASIAIGTHLGYGTVHEQGWSGTQRVPSHTRTVAFGRKVAPYRVDAYLRRMNIPARPYLSPALEDAADRFDDLFGREIAREIER
jgi:phage gpG-like protein